MSDASILSTARLTLGKKPDNLAEDEIFSEVDRTPDGAIIGIRFGWSELLLLAATELASAFGAHLDEALADKLVKALFGASGDSEYQAEVISRLGRIEAKLDKLLTFLREEFPEIVRQINREEFAEATRKQLNTAAVEVEGEIKRFLLRKTSQNAASLRAAAIRAAGLGHQLLQYGPGAYTCGIHAMGSFLPAMSHLLRFDRAEYRSDMNHWAGSYLKLVRPFLDSSVEGSLAHSRARAELALSHAAEVFNSLPGRLLSSVFLHIPNYENRGDLYQVYATELTGWNGSTWNLNLTRDGIVVDKGGTQTKESWAEQVKAKLVPWFEPVMSASPSPHSVTSDILHPIAVRESRQFLRLPPAIDSLRQQITSCEKLVSSLEAMQRF